MGKKVVKRTERIEQTMNKLQTAAFEIFSKNGFKSSSTRMIANKAKVNVALISRYFGSKEGLFVSIVKNHIHRIKTRELPYPPQNTLEEELNLYFAGSFEDIAENQKFIKIVLFQAVSDPKFAISIKQHLLFGDNRLRERIKLLQDKGALNNGIAVEEIERSITAFIRGICTIDSIIFAEPSENIKKTTEGFINVILQGCASVKRKI